jgi:AhpD family alkylhydroperoxidase
MTVDRGLLKQTPRAATSSRRRSGDALYPSPGPALADRRRALAPEIEDAFRRFGHAVFSARALPRKTKQLIAVAVAHVTQCPYCIRGHTKLAIGEGATHEEVMEAIWVAVEMRAGGSFAHSALALDSLGSTKTSAAPSRSGRPAQSPKAATHDETEASL